MQAYEIVIGLEVHVQLQTESKVFCGCSTKFGQVPNSATCPVCLGLPGVLPVLNEKAFNLALKTALALSCKVQKIIKFDRKNYYYPDLPKNYQISQFDKPLGFGGFLDIEEEKKPKRINITRVHLEEDAGKLLHDPKRGRSYVDLNRAGTPLLEIVSEPDIRSPEEAASYLKDLKAILLCLEVSDCNMEEGSLRCDANISVRKKGEKTLGVKTELKNMNSFKAIRDALHYESKRQTELVKNKDVIKQETRLWNEDKQITIPMRTKEESHDYRYFPEPDLVPFTVEAREIDRIKKENSELELPRAKRKRFISECGLNEYDAEMLTSSSSSFSSSSSMGISDFFEETLKITRRPKEIANWLLGDIASFLNESRREIEETKMTPKHLAELVDLIACGEITGKVAKNILPDVIEKGIFPREIVDMKGLRQMKDDTKLSSIIEEVLSENTKSGDDYKKGKINALMFLVGQVMKKTKGKASPQRVSDILKEKLKN